MQAYRVARWSSREERPGEQLCRLLRRHFVVSRHLCYFHAKRSCCPSSCSPASEPCGIWMALCVLFLDFQNAQGTYVMSRCKDASDNLARCLEKPSDSRPCNFRASLRLGPRQMYIMRERKAARQTFRVWQCLARLVASL